MSDGIQTHNYRNHNPGLYQLSYAQHKTSIIAISEESKILIKVFNRKKGKELPKHVTTKLKKRRTLDLASQKD